MSLLLQVWKGADEKQPRKSGNTVFPIITLWELSVAMETEFCSDLAQNLMQLFPHPNDASDRVSLWSARWLRRYSYTQTDGHTEDGSMGIL